MILSLRAFGKTGRIPIRREAGDNVRRGELPRWDSLGHLELQSTLEKEFMIEIPVDDVLTMETVGDVRRTVAKLCAAK